MTASKKPLALSTIPNEVGFSLTVIFKDRRKFPAVVYRAGDKMHTLYHSTGEKFITFHGVKWSDLAGWE